MEAEEDAAIIAVCQHRNAASQVENHITDSTAPAQELQIQIPTLATMATTNEQEHPENRQPVTVTWSNLMGGRPVYDHRLGVEFPAQHTCSHPPMGHCPDYYYYNDHSHEKKHKRCISGKVIALFVAFSLCMAALVTLQIYHERRINQRLTAAENAEVCLPCDHLRLSSAHGADFSKAFPRKTRNATVVCCAKTPAERNNLMIVITKKLAMEPLARRAPSEAAAASPLIQEPPVKAAHLILNTEQERQGSDRDVDIKAWRSDVAHKSFNRGGDVFKFDEETGSFLVVEAGFYSIASHVHLKMNGLNRGQFQHKVISDSTGAGKLTLLEDTSRVRNRPNDTVSELNGLFYIHRNTHIKVQVRPKTKLCCGNSSVQNYFSLRYLGHYSGSTTNP